MKVGLTPACAQACPTASIQFGTITDLRQRAQGRVDQLHQRGESRAYIYGDDSMLGGLNSFYLLVDKPEVYGCPPTRSSRAATCGRARSSRWPVRLWSAQSGC